MNQWLVPAQNTTIWIEPHSFTPNIQYSCGTRSWMLIAQVSSDLLLWLIHVLHQHWICNAKHPAVPYQLQAFSAAGNKGIWDLFGRSSFVELMDTSSTCYLACWAFNLPSRSWSRAVSSSNLSWFSLSIVVLSLVWATKRTSASRFLTLVKIAVTM